MLNVVIVDDESDVRDRLTNMLMKIESGFKLTATYENGIDAYNGVINNPPDLLITDIKIPYINGIDLIRKIRETEPFIKVIIITGYDEIDYTKQAIDLEVIGFLSKPISIEELTRILRKAEKRINQEYSISSSLSELKAFKQQNLSIIRENDLSKLITQKRLTPQFQTKLMNVGVDLTYEYFMIGVFDYDQNIEDSDFEESQLNLLSIKHKLENDFKSYDKELFSKDNQLVMILKSHKKLIYEEIEKYLSYELMRLQRYSQVNISVGFSEISQEPHDFKQLYLNAIKALELRRVMNESKVFFYDSLQDVSTANKTIDDLEYKNLTYLLKYRPLEEVCSYLDNLKSTIMEPEYHASFYFLISNILNTMLQSCDDITSLYSEYMDASQLYLKLSHIKTVDEAFQWFEELAKVIKRVDEAYIGDSIDVNLAKIKDYIEAHFTDEDISLTVVSDHVHLSPGYISSLLKKQYNLTFVKYLTMLRMEKARELLSNPQLKIIDVSEQLGFNDAYYFSHCFKKYYDVSPKEFRSNEKNS
jgi:two-component system, response regulator YesN